MYETDGLPPGWVDRACAVDEIWVPSSFAAETFRSAGVPAEKIKTLAAPIDLERFRYPSELSRRPSPFTFLSVFRWQYRKGWDILLQAYLAEFTPDEDVQLILHALPLKEDVLSPAKQVEQALGVTLGKHHALVDIRTRPLPHAEVPALYREADSFVLASRGEGCGRPYMEAMAAGLPTIGTRWSGNLDFMSDECALLIDAEVVPVSSVAAAEWPLFTGQSWAEPDQGNLRQLMRRVYEMPLQERRCLGDRGREAVKAYGGLQVVERQLTGHLARIAEQVEP
jgi:glycosyltransferase involved in cell wall biosynthesis